MIELKNIRFKNFLSFGSRIQEVPILNGVNIVLGHDKDKDKSNGAGKSSFLETIPFALYGQIHKNVKKEDIINWKNRKACVVELDFTKGNKEYRVVRGIKPNIFDIYEDNTLIDKPSHSRDYQIILEDIIGLNFQTFMSLVHTNINSSQPVLSMSKPEKRKFIEKVFGLELYSSLNEIANNKLRSVNDKIRECEIRIEGNRVRSIEVTSSISSLEAKIKQTSSTFLELRETKELLDELYEKIDGSEDELYDVKNDIINKQTQVAQIDVITNNIKNKSKNTITYKFLPPIEASYSSLLKYKEEYDAVSHKKVKLDELISEWHSKDDVLDLIKETEMFIEDGKNIISDLLIEKRESILYLENLNKEIFNLKNQITSLEKGAICPTCGQKIKEIPIDHIEYIKKEVEIKVEKTKEVKSLIKEVEIKINEHDTCLSLLKDDKNNIIKVFNYMLNVENELGKIREVKDEEIKFFEDKKLKYEKTNEKLDKLLEKLKLKRDRINTDIKLHEERKHTLELQFKKIDETKEKINSLEQKIQLEEDNKKEFKSMLEREKAISRQILIDNEEYNNLIVKQKNIGDYLNAIKWVCKDDNIKKFAISYKMPYLNSRVNHYLSEVGYGFYAVIDKWLDVVIKAPGIPNGGYGSLSGGEARGIDLSLQFAIHDIARLQSGIWPDTMVMDEILDSSIDGKGIEKIMGIIKTKQIEQNNKIFIISHREEMDQFEPDNIYFVEKEDGYSKIKIQ